MKINALLHSEPSAFHAEHFRCDVGCAVITTKVGAASVADPFHSSMVGLEETACKTNVGALTVKDRPGLPWGMTVRGALGSSCVPAHVGVANRTNQIVGVGSFLG